MCHASAQDSTTAFRTAEPSTWPGAVISGVRALALAPYLEPRGVYFILVLSTGEAENESCRPPGPDQGALARAPTRPAPSALPRSAFAVPARTTLRACAPLAILTVPACSLGRRATAETASAADAGPGGRDCTRARVKPAGASAKTAHMAACEAAAAAESPAAAAVFAARRRRRHGNRRSRNNCMYLVNC